MKRICIVIFLFLICISFKQVYAPNLSTYQIHCKEVTKERIIRLDELLTAEFSESNLRELLMLLDAPSPDIIVKQSKLETGWYKSKLFVYHNSLFGMHYPRLRDTYSDRYTIADNGSKCASYGSWQASVLDLLIFFEYCESFGYSTANYYKFLVDVGYCEKDIYINILKKMS